MNIAKFAISTFPTKFPLRRFGSKSATATPTGSPKKRQLPQIPAHLHATFKDRLMSDFDDRARFMRPRSRQVHASYHSGGENVIQKYFPKLLLN